MRYFEQATSLAHRILGMAVAQSLESHFGIHVALTALRGLSAAAALLLAYWLFKTVRLFGNSWEAAGAAFMLTVSSFALRYATEIKQYAFEAAASAAVLYAGAILARHPRRAGSLALFLAVALLGYAFSLTLLLVVAAVSVGLAASALSEDRKAASAARGTKRRFVADLLGLLRTHRALILVCLAAGLGGVAFYLLYSRPVTPFQFAANPDRYGNADIKGSPLFGLLKTPVELVQHLYATLAPLQGWRVFDRSTAGHALTFGFAALLLVTFYLSLRCSLFLATSAASLFVILVVLHLLGIFPFVWDRQFYFALPLFAAVLVLGMGEGLDRLRRVLPGDSPRRLVPAFFIVFCGIYLAAGLGALRGLKVEEVSPLLRRIAAVSPTTPVWVYYGAQPAFGVLASPTVTELGGLNHESSATGWEVVSGARNPHDLRQTDDGYVKSAVALLGQQKDVWLLFAHDRGADADQKQIVGAIDAGGHRCSLDTRTPGAALYRCQPGAP